MADGDADTKAQHEKDETPVQGADGQASKEPRPATTDETGTPEENPSG